MLEKKEKENVSKAKHVPMSEHVDSLVSHFTAVNFGILPAMTAKISCRSVCLIWEMGCRLWHNRRKNTFWVTVSPRLWWTPWVTIHHMDPRSSGSYTTS